jgi:hypothetical protein
VISFLEAEKMLRCSEDEKRREIPECHYTHIESFLDSFKQKHLEAASKMQTVSNVLLPQQKQALNYLVSFSALPFVNDAERKLIERAKDAIRQQKYVKLYKEINRIAKNKLKPVENLQTLMHIIAKYIDENHEEEAQRIDATESGERPEIIISETFVTKE